MSRTVSLGAARCRLESWVVKIVGLVVLHVNEASVPANSFSRRHSTCHPLYSAARSSLCIEAWFTRADRAGEWYLDECA